MEVYKNKEEHLRIEAEKEAQIQKQVKELSTLETLEEKLEYWTTNLKHRSLFRGIGKGEEILNLLEGATNRNERLEVVKAEISRLDETNEDFLSTRFRKRFYSRIAETNDIELTKTKFIEKIEKHINTKEFPDIYTKHKLKGFKAYNGGRSIESKVEDLQSFSIGLKDRSFFKYTYEGYLLAELVSEIKKNTKSEEAGQTKDNRIEVNITAEKFAALMYLLSTKGVFDLAYFDFNTNYYNGEETAKLCQKHFKIISQKGKTKGQEVSFETLKKAFKESVITTTLETGIDNLFEALVNLPKLNKTS